MSVSPMPLLYPLSDPIYHWLNQVVQVHFMDTQDLHGHYSLVDGATTPIPIQQFYDHLDCIPQPSLAASQAITGAKKRGKQES
jgi:hypothetical protein